MVRTSALVVTIAGTPDRCLSQNARGHWGSKSRATKQARTDAYWATFHAIDGDIDYSDVERMHHPLTLHAVIAWEKGRKRMDQQNAIGILKATFDGIADALGVDDKHFTVGTVTQDRDEAGVGYIRVAIETAVKQEAA